MRKALTILLGLTMVVVAAETFAQGTWTTKAPMPTARGNFEVGVAADLVGDKLYAVGGFNNAGGALTTVEAYDPDTNTWSTRAPMSTPRNGIGVGVVDGLVYAVGGDTDAGNAGFLASVEAYDPLTNTWVARAPMPTPRNEVGVGVVDGILYAVGGYNGVYHSTVEAYNPVTNTWSPRAPMPTARSVFAVGVVDGVLYAVGGQNGSEVLSTVVAYDPVTDTWSTRAPMPTARAALASAVVNGILYAIGGINGGCSTPCSVVEAYDPGTDTWTTVSPPMPTGRYYLAAGVIGSSFYAVGGASAQGYVGVLEVFTPEPAVDEPVPATLTLSPAAAMNPVGTNHTVTATVQDADGNPVPGVTVQFSVIGSISTSGSCTTDENGQCSFTYTGPATPGVDAITAYADTDNDNVQDVSEPDGAAGKTWFVPLPEAQEQCKNGGWQTFGVFKNQGDCVSFLSTEGRNPPFNLP